MGSVARTISKPFEWLGDKAGELVGGLGGILTPKMPEIPAVTYTPPETPETPAEPAGPGASASESSSAQDERNRLLASLSRKKTKTLLTGSQGLTSAAGVGKKKLLGE